MLGSKILFEAGEDEEAIAEMVELVEDKVERNGGTVYRTNSNLTTEHPMESTVLALVGVLGILGILIMFLSSSLIINTLNALLTQHRRQIGVMKLVGARGLNISIMYIALIIAFGIIAVVMVFSAFKVVTTANVVHAALYLVLVLAGGLAAVALFASISTAPHPSSQFSVPFCLAKPAGSVTAWRLLSICSSALPSPASIPCCWP